VGLEREAADSVDQGSNMATKIISFAFMGWVQPGDEVCQRLDLARRSDGDAEEPGELSVSAAPGPLSDVNGFAVHAQSPVILDSHINTGKHHHLKDPRPF
jgi:hypothetical protein